MDHRGALEGPYLRAIEALGALRDPEGVKPLGEALHKGEWWAPRRTREIRTAAASALARIGTPEAQSQLEEAAKTGPRGLRSIARAQLASFQLRRAQRTGAA
jgi:HEAT repeat protein